MKRILIDTNFYVAFKRNDPLVIDLLKRMVFIGISPIVLGELLSGFRLGTKEEQNRKELDAFLNSPRINFLSIDDETPEYYAKIFQDLSNKGTPIPSNDIWIASSAMQHGLLLATFDDHFNYIEGLMTYPSRR